MVENHGIERCKDKRCRKSKTEDDMRGYGGEGEYLEWAEGKDLGRRDKVSGGMKTNKSRLHVGRGRQAIPERENEIRGR